MYISTYRSCESVSMHLHRLFIIDINYHSLFIVHHYIENRQYTYKTDNA